MKPISLKIGGLHSFRSPQVADFESLCAAGLFGIFGPTGSGKSTVLDAITLALYGKVERASHGTQGILNHAEDKVIVEFTFEINQPAGRKRYRIERVYRRGGNNSVTSGGARLVEITGGEERPIAEKSKVTEEITSMLGLTVDDFTRAVVLPQGKFDEFLKKIKPLERRRMLERLFGLSEYGDKLRQKVASRLNDAENKLASVQGELEGLGDASDDALGRAEEQLREIGSILEQAAKQLQQLEKEYKEKDQIRIWQEEKEGLEQALNLLQSQAPQIEENIKKLDAAKRAGQLAPYLQEVDEAKSSYEVLERDYKDIDLRHNLAGRDAQAAEDAYHAANLKRQQEEPELLARKSALVRAVELERELQSIKGEESNLIKTIRALDMEKADHETSLEQNKQAKNTLEQEIAKLKTGIAQAQVDPQKRRTVQLSLLALGKWRQAAAELKKARDDRNQKEDMLAKAQRAWSEAEYAERKNLVFLEQAAAAETTIRDGCPEDEDALRKSFMDLERLRHQVGNITRQQQAINEALVILANNHADLERARTAAGKAGAALAQAETARENAGRHLQALEEKVTELRHRNMAYYLARSLKEGEPCPVCGSVGHPAPAITDAQDELGAADEELRQAKAAADTAQKLLEKAQRDELSASTNLNTADKAVREARDRLQSLKDEMNVARGNLPPSWSELTPEKLEQELDHRERHLHKRERALKDWRGSLEAAQKELQAARDACSGAQVMKAQAESAFSGARSALEEARQRVKSAELEADQYLNELNAVRGDMAVDQIAGEQQKIERADADRSKLEKQRETKELNLVNVSNEVDRISALNSDLAIQLSQSREKLAGIRDRRQEKETELNQICHGQPARELLHRAEARLKELAAAEQRAQQEMRSADAIKGRLEQSLAAAARALAIAEERLENGQAKLDQSLDALHFATRNEAEQALLSKAEQDEMQKTVDEYHMERDRLRGLLLNLEAKLGQRALSPEEWQGLQHRLSAARRAHEEALTARGAAAREYAKLAGANARWKELNHRAQEMGGLIQKLGILRDLLRGNAFVDFLAEEQLIRVTGDASTRLGQLTKHRYALEVDSEGGFVIRDEANGGVKRPVSTLSGGETFVASLALALALSTQIQLKGSYPLEFFFLDEGFGTLDPELLEVVVTTLEKLRLENFNIGIISHVPELKNRLPRRLIVQPAQASGTGSRLELEFA